MKKLIFIFFILLWWIVGYGQDQKDKGNRSSSYIEINDFAGFDSPCKSDLETIAGEVKTLLQTGGTEVKIIVAKVYPPSVYMQKKDGLNAMAEVTKKQVAVQYTNYILVLAQFIEDEKLNIEIVMKLPGASMPSSCHNNINVLQESLNKTLKEKLGEGSSGMANVECATKEILTTFKEKVQSGCSIDGKDRRAWFEAQGFETRKLGALKLDFGSNARPNKVISNSRSTCGYADYTNSQLKYSVSGSGLQLITQLANEQVQTAFQRRIIFTDKNVSPALFSQIYSEEMISPSCEVTIWLHFEQGFDGGEDEVLIMVARQNKPPASTECYSYESLKDKYKNDSNFLTGSQRITFRFHNHKDAVIGFIQTLNYKGIPYSSLTELTYYAGLTSGFADGLIETIDLISMVGQTYKEISSTYDPTSAEWWLDLYTSMNDKRNLYEAFNEKWGETYKAWIHIYDKAYSTYNSLTNDPSQVGEVFNLFYQSIMKVLDNYIDSLLFKNGTYEQGYAVGKTIFEFIPITHVAKVGKGASALLKLGKGAVGDMAKNIGEEISESGAKAALKDATIDLGDLLLKLKTRTNLIFWFNNGMPAWVKIRLASMPDDVLNFLEDAIKKYPNLKNEWLATPKMFDFAESLHRDWWAKFGLGGLSKRAQGGISTDMKNLIGDTEVTTNGVKKGKVKTFVIGDETPGTIGRAFDDEIIQRLINTWGSGNFDNFPPSMRVTLSNIHAQGYKFVKNEPRLSINGQNFDPDILFVKTNVVQGITVTDIKYIDVKYLDDVPFNSGGQSAIKAAVSANGNTTVVNTTGLNLIDALTDLGIPSTAGNLTITSVEKLSVKVSDLGLIIN